MRPLKPQEILLPNREIVIDGRTFHMRPLSMEMELRNLRAIATIAQALLGSARIGETQQEGSISIPMPNIINALAIATDEIVTMLQYVLDEPFADLGNGAIYVLATNFIEMNFHDQWFERFFGYTRSIQSLGAYLLRATTPTAQQPATNDSSSSTNTYDKNNSISSNNEKQEST